MAQAQPPVHQHDTRQSNKLEIILYARQVWFRIRREVDDLLQLLEKKAMQKADLDSRIQILNADFTDLLQNLSRVNKINNKPLHRYARKNLEKLNARRSHLSFIQEHFQDLLEKDWKFHSPRFSIGEIIRRFQILSKSKHISDSLQIDSLLESICEIKEMLRGDWEQNAYLEEQIKQKIHEAHYALKAHLETHPLILRNYVKSHTETASGFHECHWHFIKEQMADLRLNLRRPSIYIWYPFLDDRELKPAAPEFVVGAAGGVSASSSVTSQSGSQLNPAAPEFVMGSSNTSLTASSSGVSSASRSPAPNLSNTSLTSADLPPFTSTPKHHGAPPQLSTPTGAADINTPARRGLLRPNPQQMSQLPAENHNVSGFTTSQPLASGSNSSISSGSVAQSRGNNATQALPDLVQGPAFEPVVMHGAAPQFGPPAAPSGHILYHVTGTSCHVTWPRVASHNNSPVTGYVIHVFSGQLDHEYDRTVLSEDEERRVEVPASVTSTRLTDLTPGRTYSVCVSAVNHDGLSQPLRTHNYFRIS